MNSHDCCTASGLESCRRLEWKDVCVCVCVHGGGGGGGWGGVCI